MASENNDCISTVRGASILINILVSIVLGLIVISKSIDSRNRPPYMFREFRFCVLATSIIYNTTLTILFIIRRDIFFFVYLARVFGALIQIIDHYWLCKNWENIFVKGEYARRYIWARGVIFPTITFVWSIAAHGYSIYSIGLAINCSTDFLWVFWYWNQLEYDNHRYYFVRNACLTNTIIFFIFAFTPGAKSWLAEILPPICSFSIAVIFHGQIVNSRRLEFKIHLIEESSPIQELAVEESAFVPNNNTDNNINDNIVTNDELNRSTRVRFNESDNVINTNSQDIEANRSLEVPYNRRKTWFQFNITYTNINLAIEKTVAIAGQVSIFYCIVGYAELLAIVSGLNPVWCPTFDSMRPSLNIVQTIADILIA